MCEYKCGLEAISSTVGTSLKSPPPLCWMLFMPPISVFGEALAMGGNQLVQYRSPAI